MNQLVVERASVEEESVVVDILTQARDEQLRRAEAPAWRNILVALVRNDIEVGISYLVRDGATAIGTVSVQTSDRVWPDFPDDALYPHRLAVLPAFGRQGVGRFIVGWVERMAVEASRHYIRLDVVAEGTRVRSWYERQGFQPKDSVHPTFYSRPVIRYEKPVDAA